MTVDEASSTSPSLSVHFSLSLGLSSIRQNCIQHIRRGPTTLPSTPPMKKGQQSRNTAVMIFASGHRWSDGNGGSLAVCPLQQTRNVLLECMWGDTFTFGDVSYALSHSNLQSLTPLTPTRSSHLEIGNLPDHSSGPRESICGRVAVVWRQNHSLSSGPSPSNSVQVTFPEKGCRIQYWFLNRVLQSVMSNMFPWPSTAGPASPPNLLCAKLTQWQAEAWFLSGGLSHVWPLLLFVLLPLPPNTSL